MRGDDLQNNFFHGGQQPKHIADLARAAAEQHSGNTCIAAAPEQRQNRGRISRSSTSCTPEAVPGTSVEEGEPGGARAGKAYYYIPGRPTP